jgi:hypothetical protein
LCQTNIDDLLTESWLRELIARGVHYVWYYAYRPVGPNPCFDLALGPDQLLRMRKFIVEMRSKHPILIIETYYDHLGRSLCPMATGLSHHVSPRGEIEPCPVIQFARENIRDDGGVYRAITKSEFLRDFRVSAAAAMRGCVVLERPDLVAALVQKHQARDTTVRQNALAEAARIPPGFSQWLPGHEIPEGHWMYYYAKKFFFNDFGAYAKTRHQAEARAAELKRRLDRDRGEARLA